MGRARRRGGRGETRTHVTWRPVTLNPERLGRCLELTLAADYDAAMDSERFEALVDEAVAGLPPEIAERLDNVDVVVERRPTRTLLREMGLLGRGTLLGLYRGVPQVRRNHAYGLVMPDRIAIYRDPILAAVRADLAPGEEFEEAVRARVRQTVLHEFGHHFGLDEDGLARLDY